MKVEHLLITWLNNKHTQKEFDMIAVRYLYAIGLRLYVLFLEQVVNFCYFYKRHNPVVVRFFQEVWQYLKRAYNKFFCDDEPNCMIAVLLFAIILLGLPFLQNYLGVI